MFINIQIPQVFVLHWDGKLLPDIKGIEKQDRLSLVVTSENMEKLLGIPKIETSSGENIADATLNFLRHWALDGLVEIISFDTTATNTGVNNGAAYLLEKKLGRKLLFLPCRHHISELLVRSVFELNFGKTSGPEVLLFNRFAKFWKNIEPGNFTKGTLDEVVLHNLPSSQFEYLKSFCLNALKCHYVRADYKELLQLTLHFIGEQVPHFTQFRLPGATSHARFMSKCIYCLKMFLFRNQFKMTAAELKSLRTICLFLINIYVPYWFRSVNAIEAPQLDLDLIQKIIPYFDKAISSTLLQKLRNHLWYLAEENVGLSFFDGSVPLEIKKKMVQKLGIDNEDEDEYDGEVSKRNAVTLEEMFSYSGRDISHFVSSRTKIFFNRLSIDASFLQVDPSEWSQRDDYCGGKRVCQHLNVVNDAAERAIKLITDFNRSLTYDEEDKQFLLQVVEHYRKLYPSHNKFALMS